MSKCICAGASTDAGVCHAAYNPEQVHRMPAQTKKTLCTYTTPFARVAVPPFRPGDNRRAFFICAPRARVGRGASSSHYGSATKVACRKAVCVA